MKRTQIVILLLLVCKSLANGQGCPNINFNFNDFTYWSGNAGTCCPINLTTPGIVSGQHNIISTPGGDPNVGGLLQMIPTGYTTSLRLGNNITGAQAEGISYDIIVDEFNSLFIYKYAVVLEDPGHSPMEQPRFEMVVKDQNGIPINCTEYSVVSNPSEPGFNTYNGTGGPIIWKDWTTVGVDLSAYIGQNVTIEAKTGDCALGGHYGYAYFVGKCMPLQINLFYCSGDSTATLTAPDGFQTYLWSTGETTQSIIISDPLSAPPSITCTITSYSGCQVVLNAPIIEYQTTADFNFQANCIGEVDFTDLSTSTNGIVSYWNWSFGDGQFSSQTNPVHQYPDTGSYQVQLIANAGCPDTISATVIVDSLIFVDFGFLIDCLGEATFSDSSFSSFAGSIYNWNFGDGGTSNLINPTHTYNFDGIYDVTLTISTTGGCTASATQTLNVGNSFFASFDYNTVFCLNSSTTIFNQSIYQNTTTPTAQWFINNTPVATTYNLNYTFNSDTATSITLVMSNTDNCLDTFTVPIVIMVEVPAIFTTSDVCFNQLTGFSYAGPIYSGIYLYWDFGDGSESSGMNYFNESHQYLLPGTYNVTLITDIGTNCTDTTTQLVEVFPGPVVNYTTSTDCFNGVTFTNLSSNTQGTNYTWNFGDGSSEDNNSANVIHAYSSNGFYSTSLFATSPNGCTAITYVAVSLNNTFVIPTADSFPNVLYRSSAVNNDEWNLQTKFAQFNECLNYTFYVYNRWGVLVFETTNKTDNPDLNCDRCFKGFSSTNSPLSEGTYYYIMQADHDLSYHGYLTIIE